MARTVATNNQKFADLVGNNCFYVDKSLFLKEWWESYDEVTLITRPRRFGKTLTMDMVEHFLSNRYAEDEKEKHLFDNLAIAKDPKLMAEFHGWPVINLSFSTVKQPTYRQCLNKLYEILMDVYRKFRFVTNPDVWTDKNDALDSNEMAQFASIKADMPTETASGSLKALSKYLYRFYGKKVILLLDEYDTPLQKAWDYGYWEELIDFMCSFFVSSFKDNESMYRVLMTGITRVTQESLFSDFNNPEVITTTSEKYMDKFGFTENEVKDALAEYGLENKEQEVKDWYDGFIFGDTQHIYNPWSIVNFLGKRKFNTYWADTSSNKQMATLMRKSTGSIKTQLEDLLSGASLTTKVSEKVTYDRLNDNDAVLWGLAIAAGYVKVLQYDYVTSDYTIAFTNREVILMMKTLITEWFTGSSVQEQYSKFLTALLTGDLEVMNGALNDYMLKTFSSFDPCGLNDEQPERFYHGFVLGLIITLEDRYSITSNRESGDGRYDVMLVPKTTSKTFTTDPAIIIEFKATNRYKSETMEQAVAAALQQIEEKQYETELLNRGFDKSRIHKYGFGFKGKKVLIGEGGS